MSVNKNVNVCVVTAQRFLVEVDADRTGQKATSLLNRAAQISYVHRRLP